MDDFVGGTCVSDEFLRELLFGHDSFLFGKSKRYPGSISAVCTNFFGCIDSSELFPGDFTEGDDIFALSVY